mgnify:CR=1 FL=1
MQQTKLLPGLRAAILTFQIHKFWRRFLRIVTSKDRSLFSWRQSYVQFKLKVLISFILKSDAICRAAVAQSVSALASHAEGWVFEYWPRRSKQVVAGPLLNARKKVRVSGVLRDDHYMYKRMSHVTVGVKH